ncbi:MAG: sulfatase [Planctomycetaceae bacterium]|nr:sulfatase [Planctomycetaceae bacterium]
MSVWSWIRRTLSASWDLASTPRVMRSGLTNALHVFVLLNFAVAQPLYELLGRQTTFLVNERISLNALVLLTFGLSCVLPAAFVLLEWSISRISRKDSQLCHTLIVFVLLLLLALPIVNQTTMLPGLISITAALITTGFATWCYLRFPNASTIVTCAAPGILLFPALLLFYSSNPQVNGDSCSSQTARFDPVPIVVLVCDEFCGSSLMTPERTIDANRFPNFAALASQSSWFRNATSVNQGTEQALPAILAGRYPMLKWNPAPVDLPQNLFTVFDASNGYQSAVFEPVSVLAPSSANSSRPVSSELSRQINELANALWRVYLFHIVPSDFQKHLPLIPVEWFGLNHTHPVDVHQKRGAFRYEWGAHRDAQFQHFLETIDESPEPSLHFMHVLLPHMPWCFMPSGHRYAEDGTDWHLLEAPSRTESRNHWGDDDWEVIQAQQRYLLQVMNLDRLIGQLIARLKETGKFDRCLLIVTADHGISFRPGMSRRRADAGNQDEIVSIPLFIKRPGQSSGQINDRHVESVDILPTIADVVGLELRQPTDGWSVFDESRPDRIQKRFGGIDDPSTFDPKIVLNSGTPGDVRRRFGDSSDPLSLFRVGPMPELVGQPLTALAHSGTNKVKLEFTRFRDVRDATPDSEVPGLFEGRVLSPDPMDQPVILAVAVNGTIQAVTRPSLLKEFRDQWSALVSDTAFHEGKNEVRFFSVSGTGPAWLLSPCDTVDASK